MARVRAEWVLGVVVLSLVGRPTLGGEEKLVICPQKISTEAGKFSLLPSAASLTDGNAVAWYEKAVKALPGEAGDGQIQQWSKMPIGQLPADQVEEILTRYVESFKCVARAVKCRECRWPSDPTTGAGAILGEYRTLAWAIGLWARYEISQGNYEGAALALQTGLGMGRHLMQGPNFMQFLVGNGFAVVMCREVREFVQAGEAPNLYTALAALPQPFTDVEKLIERQKKIIPSEPPAGMTRAQFDSDRKLTETTYNLLRLFDKRLDAEVAALQCVEAIRSYGASHGGQLPQTLAEITDVSVPNDPVSGAPFRYTRAGTAAVLESAMLTAGDIEEVVRYEITIKN